MMQRKHDAVRMGLVWTFFSRLSFLYFLHSLGDGPIQTEILSQKGVKP